MAETNSCDRVTDQEIAFSLMILSGTMSDQRAAEAVGIKAANAAHVKARPRVRDFLRQHRAAPPTQNVNQDSSLPGKDDIIRHLWMLTRISPEITRGSMVGQMKAASLLVAIMDLVPTRAKDAKSAGKQTDPLPPYEIYKAAWLREKEETDANEAQQASASPAADSIAVPEPNPEPAPGPAPKMPPNQDQNQDQTTPATRPAEQAFPSSPYTRFVPDANDPFWKRQQRRQRDP